MTECDFEEPFLCGFIESSSTELHWTRSNGFELNDDGVSPTVDSKDSYTGI